jgi:Short C-terminal domain
MNSLARDGVQRTPIFNAVSAGLLLVSAGLLMLIVSTPASPMEMMVPWARTVGMLQALIGAACVTLIWLRQGWAFYVYVGLIMFGVLVGLTLRYPLPYLAIGPGLLGLYLWALHTGTPDSMWVQLFGRSNAQGRGMAYGPGPGMPPPMTGVVPAAMPPVPPRSSAPPPLPPSAAPRPTPPAPPAPREASTPTSTPTSAPATLVAPHANAVDPLDALKRLGALRDSGAITEAEFAAKKAELLQRL